MKLLENSSFEALSSRLCVEMGESRILGRWVSTSWQQIHHTIEQQFSSTKVRGRQFAEERHLYPVQSYFVIQGGVCLNVNQVVQWSV